MTGTFTQVEKYLGAGELCDGPPNTVVMCPPAVKTITWTLSRQ